MFKGTLRFEHAQYEIGIEDVRGAARTGDFGPYDVEIELGLDGYDPHSQHSVIVKSAEGVVRSALLSAGMGATGVHPHSALLYGDTVIVAVGPFLCCLKLPNLELLWQVQSDIGACFGVYEGSPHDCFFSHGELQIARVSRSGEIEWSFSGRDIFTGGFKLTEKGIEVTDFENDLYRIDPITGVGELVKPLENRSPAIEFERALLSVVWPVWLLALIFCWTMVLMGIWGQTWDWHFSLSLVCGLGLVWFRLKIEAWGLDILKRLKEEQNRTKTDT